MTDYNEPNIVTAEEIAEVDRRFQSAGQARQALQHLEEKNLVEKVDSEHWRVKSRARCLGYIIQVRLRRAYDRAWLWLADRLSQE